jgi:hypothetical protein
MNLNPGLNFQKNQVLPFPLPEKFHNIIPIGKDKQCE